MMQPHTSIHLVIWVWNPLIYRSRKQFQWVALCYAHLHLVINPTQKYTKILNVPLHSNRTNKIRQHMKITSKTYEATKKPSSKTKIMKTYHEDWGWHKRRKKSTTKISNHCRKSHNRVLRLYLRRPRRNSTQTSSQ